jgi:hypothetical protein
VHDGDGTAALRGGGARDLGEYGWRRMKQKEGERDPNERLKG